MGIYVHNETPGPNAINVEMHKGMLFEISRHNVHRLAGEM